MNANINIIKMQIVHKMRYALTDYLTTLFSIEKVCVYFTFRSSDEIP